MSMKKTDLEKHLAKKLDGRLRTGLTPQRFGQGSEVVKDKAEQKVAQAAKLVPVSCRCRAGCRLNWSRSCASARSGSRAA